MMKKLTKILATILLACIMVTCLASCSLAGIMDAIGGLFGGKIDYAAQLTLDMGSETAKEEVTIKLHVDGDTVHFNSSVGEKGVLKARFLAINTPESTGKIEKWGKKASAFTKEKLKNAVSIIVESDDENWNLDSTGARHLVWVWYKSSEDAEYRNLNLEILQEGLAIASNTSENRYGEICMKALEQAQKLKLYCHSGEDTVDPELYVGDAVDLTIKELRTNIQNYVGMDVAFEGVVTKKAGGGCYVEAYDEENNMYNGIYIYLGNGASGYVENIMSVGNYVKVIGNVQYWEGGASYQVTNLKYRAMAPDDPKNIKKLGEGEASFKLTSADEFVNGVINIEVVEDGEEVFKQVRYAQLALGSTISMNNLQVVKTYVSDNNEMTLTCKVDGITIKVRTEVLFENGQVVDDSRFQGTTIDVKGIVDSYNGEYQIRVFGLGDIAIH